MSYVTGQQLGFNFPKFATSSNKNQLQNLQQPNHSKDGMQIKLSFIFNLYSTEYLDLNQNHDRNNGGNFLCFFLLADVINIYDPIKYPLVITPTFAAISGPDLNPYNKL